MRIVYLCVESCRKLVYSLWHAFLHEYYRDRQRQRIAEGRKEREDEKKRAIQTESDPCISEPRSG